MSQKTILILILYLFLGKVSLAADTLHAIIVADTANWNGGASFETDLKKMKILTNEIAQHTKLMLNFKAVSDMMLTHNQVKLVVEGLSVKAKHDVVIFFYAGHGGRTSGKWSFWPLLDIKGGILDMDWVKATLERKKPRFFIILTDTCNHVNDALSPVWARSAPDNAQSSTEGYRQLFLNYQGYVFASAASPGEKAWGNAQYGGFFRDAFERSLRKASTSSNPSWNTIMKQVEAPIEIEGNKQHPKSIVKIEAVHAGIATPTEDDCSYFYKPNGVLCCRKPNGVITCDDTTEEEACPHYFYKPGGVLCCHHPSGDTCE